ncbi:MAG: 16S rRNA (guanine(527)-N(7))-methyltransferase RsmG [Elusimicrobiales bacterium]|nr:16S rRNA (guanine(527)-N(7))-methyltransferase RsmG [Elusimicrobiales bacterium]HOJ86334.1 16S rRNA (guanine(527)-N(7))-methyltransferase RsmG [Elusimicrobiales bacterium]HOL63437.1 16S rRNA (guanine(527)-N(7))-methyltransferase RsmG [Elusimicrobiales bacterium]HPO96007.1 16S rRNA (guanine(527)-N(7))-methyltransferase RsmG [Elusimicrobiales bacterium]
MLKQIEKTIKEYSLDINDDSINLLSEFAKEILDKNQKINLISKSDEKNIIERHIIDSAMVLKSGFISEKINNIIDIGSGAGFPGAVIGIIYPEIKITLCEQREKKAMFLIWIKQKLKLDNIEILNKRIDKKNQLKYDMVTQRAAAQFEEIYPIAYSLLNENGTFVSWMSEKDITKIKDDKKPDFIYNYYLKDGIKRSLGLWRKKDF